MSDPSWLEQAARTDLNRRDLTALAARLPADLGEALARAAADRDARTFCPLLLAGLHRGDRLDATPFFRAGAALLPDAATLAAAAGHLEGPVGELLLGAATDGKLGWDLEACALLIAAFWGRRAKRPDPPELLGRARVLARKAPGALADEALAALVGLTGDAGLEAGLGPALDDRLRDQARSLAEYLVARFTGPVLEAVPELPGTRYQSEGPLQRASAKIGRNQPCPCGSGKKYKHCHERIDRSRESDASDVSGLTRAELQDRLAEFLSPERLDAMRAHELIRLDPQKVPRPLVPHWLDRMAFHRDWETIEAAYAALDDPTLDELLVEHAGTAAWIGDVDAARALLRHFHGEDPPLRTWARAALASEPAEVGELADRSAREHLDEGAVEAAYALLRGPWKALGILAARAVLPQLPLEGAEPLLAEILDTREALGLEPWDPVEDVLYRLTHGADPEVARQLSEAEQRLAANRAQLAGAAAELRALRQQLEARQADPPAAEEPGGTAPVARPAAPAEDAETRALRERLSRLKEDLKARHAERNALRRELQEVKARIAEGGAERGQVAPPAPEAPEEAPADPPADAQHDGRLRLPRWSEGFVDALARVPDKVARAAVDKLCAVAVGRQGAFVEVRRLRGRAWLWRAKVGRSYRLLFRLDDQGIEALDLVHRQDLEKRIKQLAG